MIILGDRVYTKCAKYLDDSLVIGIFVPNIIYTMYFVIFVLFSVNFNLSNFITFSLFEPEKYTVKITTALGKISCVTFPTEYPMFSFF